MWNPIMRGLLGYGSTLIALYMFWFVAGRPLMVKEPEVDDNHRLYSVSYSPLEKDQSPFDFAKGLTISEFGREDSLLDAFTDDFMACLDELQL